MSRRTVCTSRESVTHRWVQAILTAVFFLQSLSLILGDAEFLGAALGAAQTLNLDVEEAAEACVAPLTTDQRFYGACAWHPRVSQVGQAVALCAILFYLCVVCRESGAHAAGAYARDEAIGSSILELGTEKTTPIDMGSSTCAERLVTEPSGPSYHQHTPLLLYATDTGCCANAGMHEYV
jgi:hypothetical protein